MSSIYEIPVQKISGADAFLSEFKGKVLPYCERGFEVRIDPAV